jgi:hypothetical protein
MLYQGRLHCDRRTRQGVIQVDAQVFIAKPNTAKRPPILGKRVFHSGNQTTGIEPPYSRRNHCTGLEMTPKPPASQIVQVGSQIRRHQFPGVQAGSSMLPLPQARNVLAQLNWEQVTPEIHFVEMVAVHVLPIGATPPHRYLEAAKSTLVHSCLLPLTGGARLPSKKICLCYV